MDVKELLIKFQEYQLEFDVLNANFAHNSVANKFMERFEIINSPLLEVKWDTELGNIGIPSNMCFTFGSEFDDIVYRLQKTKEIRWCIFKVDSTYYVIEQELINRQWYATWTKQMNRDLIEAKEYLEKELIKYYSNKIEQ